MECKPRKRVITMWRVILVTVSVMTIAVVLKESLYRWKGGRWLGATKPHPALVLGAIINGQPAELSPATNLVQGSTITPTLDVDWGGGTVGSTELTLTGKVIPAGKPITLTEPGTYRLSAEAHTGRWARTRTVVFEVTEFPRLEATAAVERFNLQPFELVLRLSAEAFDIAGADPLTVSLGLYDTRNKPIDRIGLATKPDGSPDATFTGSEWILRFDRPEAARALATRPARLILSAGGSREGERIDITADATLPELP